MKEKKLTAAAKIIHEGISIMRQVNEDSPTRDKMLAVQIDNDIQNIIADCAREGITIQDINMEMVFLFSPNPCRYVH